ncbi:hypothetical protein ACQ4PT_050444 [Festuca glaucescens]
MASTLSWSDLPQDLLPLVIAGLTSPADCVRFWAVCRAWRSVPSPHRLPLIVLPKGFLTCFEGSQQIAPYRDNVRCIGTTDCWLAMDLVNAETCTHSYFSHNLFTKTTVPLPELDKIIANVSKQFKVRKVLMKSPPTGLAAVMTNSYNYPIILLQPGNGAWLPPKSQTTFLSRIIDVAFVGDTLYGITQAEDLISLRIVFGSDGLPTVANIELVIKQPNCDQETVLEEWKRRGGEYITNEGMRFEDLDYEGSSEDANLTVWYLVESRGKLLMVRRQLRLLRYAQGLSRKVEVFEADTGTKTWVLVSGVLDGQALFITKRFSRSVFACGEDFRSLNF